MTTPPRSYLKY